MNGEALTLNIVLKDECMCGSVLPCSVTVLLRQDMEIGVPWGCNKGRAFILPRLSLSTGSCTQPDPPLTSPLLTSLIKEHVAVNPRSSVCLLWSWSRIITGHNWPNLTSWPFGFKLKSAFSMVTTICRESSLIGQKVNAYLSTTSLPFQFLSLATITGHPIWY